MIETYFSIPQGIVVSIIYLACIIRFINATKMGHASLIVTLGYLRELEIPSL